MAASGTASLTGMRRPTMHQVDVTVIGIVSLDGVIDNTLGRDDGSRLLSEITILKKMLVSMRFTEICRARGQYLLFKLNRKLCVL